MNIDERLEALTQSVELLAQMHKDSEQRAERSFANLERHMVRMMQSITRLSNITAVHEVQIDDHEQRIGDLERPQQ